MIRSRFDKEREERIEREPRGGGFCWDPGIIVQNMDFIETPQCLLKNSGSG